MPTQTRFYRKLRYLFNTKVNAGTIAITAVAVGIVAALWIALQASRQLPLSEAVVVYIVITIILGLLVHVITRLR